MERKLFGTDGIRGTANAEPMTAETALGVAQAAAVAFRRSARTAGHRPLVVIGKDTRLSGYMLEPAMTAGFIAMGLDVVLVGPLPTPAVAMLTRSLRADIGVVISASHNPYQDNGIKLFGPDGFKLSDEVEAEIESRLAGDLAADRPGAAGLGRARRLDDAAGRYIEFAKATFPRGQRLDGLRVVVDCAHGAAYRVAPKVLWELGADVVPIGVEPDGTNINRGCGATDTEAMQQAVLRERADLGLALDGDADRLIVADETGRRIDGDQLLATIAGDWLSRDRLRGRAVAATVMSNLGLERHLGGLGLGLLRTKVGDRYVVEAMRSNDLNLGGEQSGHIVCTDYATTGDGLVAALQVLAVLRRSDRPASEAVRAFEPVPQRLVNVRLDEAVGDPLAAAEVRESIADAEALLGRGGRVLIRRSGTEPLVRVMAEGDDEALVARVVEQVAGTISRAAGA